MTTTHTKAIILMDIILIIALLVFFAVYNDNVQAFKKHFHIEIILIFVALIISSFSAALFHEQPVIRTLFAQREFYAFSFYFLIHKMKPEPDKLLRMFVWIAYIYVFLYLLQYVIYPIRITAVEPHFSRGSIRIAIPGAVYMVLAWFILLSNYFRTKKIRYIIGMLPFLVVVILLATRQVLGSLALSTLLYIIFSKTVKSKILMLILIVLAIIPFYYLFQNIFQSIIEVTRNDPEDIRNNIRFIAARYFLFDHNKNPLWILVGNGMPEGHSEYGKFLFRIAKELGYYQSDIGIIGNFSKFGILYVIGVFSLLAKAVFFKTSDKYSFIRYSALVTIMTLFTSGGLAIATIVAYGFMLYIIDADKHINKHAGANK